MTVDRSRFGVVFLLWQREPVYALGLATISAYVKRAMPNVRVHLVPVFPDDSIAKIVDLVVALAPDLIGVSAMAPTWLPVARYLGPVKDACPAAPICVGGYQTIVSPDETLAHPAVDAVCVGDGEQPFAELAARLCGTRPPDAAIAGLWERVAGGEVRRSAPWLVEDLAAFPFPDYSIFARDGDLSHLRPNAVESRRLLSLPVVSGRGCPYRCTYCANTTLLDLYGGRGGLLRKHDPVALVAELVRLREQWTVDFFQFWDEEFLYDHRYTRTLLAEYQSALGLPFSMFVRPESMTDELCALAADAGCHSMWFGVESGSEDYRRRYLNRRMRNAQLVAAVAAARRHGIKCMAFSMVGLPFESRADARATLDLIRALAPELAIVSQFVPLPGTPLFALCRDHDLLLPPSPDRQMWPLGSLNVKPHVGGMTEDEMRDAGAEIMAYLAAHTRIDA